MNDPQQPIELPGNDGRYDVIVVGAGHAGCEAAYAAAKLGKRVLLLSIRLDDVAYMSCNPAIGGTAKGILVREIDALGGLMGKVTDSTGIHFKILNSSRGAAVQSPRAQADKRRYSGEMKRRLEETPNLVLRQDTAAGLDVSVIDNPAPGGPIKRVNGVVTSQGFLYRAPAVIVCSGTFMKGLIHIGPRTQSGGRAGESSSETLSDSLRAAGLRIERFKTGTPPRIIGRTIDISKMERQPPDAIPRPFSHFTDAKTFAPQQRDCWQSWTNPAIHSLVEKNLYRAPLYDGAIQSTGPRYCPSFEIKIVRFADKTKHAIVAEPEGLDCEEFYLNGFSTSLPADVQLAAVRLIPGLENVEISRFGYAIEYDYAPSEQIQRTYETRTVAGLYLAGQINGTSGYEEAAAQGLLAGVNAALALDGRSPFILGRDEAYAGVMTDDLVTREIPEPYRLFTSRSEYRLSLRMDNALVRLGRRAAEIGLLSKDDDAAANAMLSARDSALDALKTLRRDGMSLFDRMKRTGEDDAAVWNWIQSTVGDAEPALSPSVLNDALREHLLIEARYDGYIRRQSAERARVARMEAVPLPADLDYGRVPSLKTEARATLARFKPATLGQAARLSGVTPADVSALAVYLKNAAG